MTNNKVNDNSDDRKYYTQSPNIVWAMCESVYEYTLWNIIKMIAWEHGECFMSTPDLAKIAMMSSGKVSQCRKSLIEKGLIVGELRKDPGYPQPVWHLSIPDLWPQNIALMSEKLSGNKDKLKWKQEQLSSSETKELSPHERGLSPDEKGLLPGETNNIQTNIQKENHTPSSGGFPKVSKDKMECQVIDGIVSCWNDNEPMNIETLVRNGSVCSVCGAPLYVWDTEKMSKKHWVCTPEQIQQKSGSGAFRQKPVNAFMELINIPEISTKQRVHWGKELEKCANSRNATVEQIVRAIEAFPDSEYKWMKPTSPFGHQFQGALDVILARVITGTIDVPGQPKRIILDGSDGDTKKKGKRIVLSD